MPRLYFVLGIVLFYAPPSTIEFASECFPETILFSPPQDVVTETPSVVIPSGNIVVAAPAAAVVGVVAVAVAVATTLLLRVVSPLKVYFNFHWCTTPVIQPTQIVCVCVCPGACPRRLFRPDITVFNWLNI